MVAHLATQRKRKQMAKLYRGGKQACVAFVACIHDELTHKKLRNSPSTLTQITVLFILKEEKFVEGGDVMLGRPSIYCTYYTTFRFPLILTFSSFYGKSRVAHAQKNIMEKAPCGKVNIYCL